MPKAQHPKDDRIHLVQSGSFNLPDLIRQNGTTVAINKGDKVRRVVYVSKA